VKGIVTSPTAALVYDFLRRAGPSPFPALAAALGLKPGRMAKALRHLRGAGYAYPVRHGGVEFWCVDGSRPAPGQEALAWFAARLEEGGGRYGGGVARFPNGQEFPVKVLDGGVAVGKWAAQLEDLRVKPLRECLRRTPS
jgi:hypothetical protein